MIALVPQGKRNIAKDEIVPDDLAKRVPGLVYDDGAPKEHVVKRSKKDAPVPE